MDQSFRDIDLSAGGSATRRTAPRYAEAPLKSSQYVFHSSAILKEGMPAIPRRKKDINKFSFLFTVIIF
jgi:hypothetical protein